MSFSAEMKDFLGAWEKGTKILGAQTDEEYTKARTDSLQKKTAVENDPDRLKLADDTARAGLEKTRAGTALIGEQTKNAPVSRAYTSALTERMRKADQDIGGYQGSGNLPPGMAAPAPGAAPAAPAIAPREDLYAYEEGGAIPDGGRELLRRRMEENDRTRKNTGLLWRGNDIELGMSRAARTADDLEADRKGISRERNGRIFYADGGAIPDHSEPDVVEPDADVDDVGVGAPPLGGTSAATDFSAARRGGPASGLPQAGYQGVISPQLVSDAVRGGYGYGVKSMGLGGRGTGARSRQQALALAQGQDALTPEEMDAARKAVDPEGRLTDSQRNMAALGSVYQYWANKGDPGRADKVAFQMLQHFRLASQRYAAIAAAAAEHGNMDMATKAALKAYSNVPDGRDMQLVVTQDGKLQYNYTDENGKTISKGVASPQEFAQAAMGLTKGGFDQSILSAAAAREGATKGTQQGNQSGKKAAVGGDKVSDMAARDEKLLDPEITKLQETWKKKNSGKEVDDKYWGDLRDGATHIMQANPNATAREAVASAQALTDPKNDKYKTTSENGMNSIKFADGQKIVLDDDAFDRLLNIQAANRRALHATEDKAKEDAKKPTRMDQAIDGAKQVGRGVANLASEAGTAIGAMGEAAGGAVSRAVPDELRQRVGSDISKVAPMVSDFAGRFRNPGAGAIPETYDSPL